MPQPEHATPVALSRLDTGMVGKKLRLAGRMLWYDPASGLVALVNGDRAVVVDVSLCVGAKSATWVRERMCQLVVLGYLEEHEDALPIPSTPGHSRSNSVAPVINPHVVLRAVLVIPDNTLDIGEYNGFLEEEL